jgi:hypothetical protein
MTTVMTKRQLNRAGRAINRCRNTLREILSELTPEQRKQIGSEGSNGLDTVTDVLYHAMERLEARPEVRERDAPGEHATGGAMARLVTDWPFKDRIL